MEKATEISLEQMEQAVGGVSGSEPRKISYLPEKVRFEIQTYIHNAKAANPAVTANEIIQWALGVQSYLAYTEEVLKNYIRSVFSTIT